MSDCSRLATDRLAADQWLTKRIVGLHSVAWGGTVEAARYYRYVTRIRVLFGVLVMYFAFLTIAALIVAADPAAVPSSTTRVSHHASQAVTVHATASPPRTD
jgi:hypothetical protein